MAAAKKGTASVARLGDRLTESKKHELEQLDQTLAERRAELAEQNERRARINTELEIATAESRTRLEDLKAEIGEYEAQRESMLACTLVTMHATKIYDWMLGLPGQRGVVVTLVDGGIELDFLDEEGEPIPGPEQPQAPSTVEQLEAVGEDAIELLGAAGAELAPAPVVLEWQAEGLEETDDGV